MSDYGLSPAVQALRDARRINDLPPDVRAAASRAIVLIAHQEELAAEESDQDE